MQVLGLDRVMIATGDMDETSSKFEDLLGLEFSDLMEPVTDTDAGAQMVQNIISDAGVELVAPRGEDNEVSRFLEENGPGLYALSIRVEDLDEAKAELEEKGVHPVGEFEYNEFREAFFHPNEFGGAFVILAEYEAPHPAVTAATDDSE